MRRHTHITFHAVIFTLCLIVVQADALSNHFAPTVSNGGWCKGKRTSFITQQGMDPVKLQELLDYSISVPADAWPEAYKNNKGILVIKNRYILDQKYNKSSANTLKKHLSSNGKSMVVALLGKAVSDHGRTGIGLEAKVYDPKWLPSTSFPVSDSRKSQISFHHILKHTSGIVPDGDCTTYCEGGRVQWNDYVKCVVGKGSNWQTGTLYFNPGHRKDYSGVGFCHLGLSNNELNVMSLPADTSQIFGSGINIGIIIPILDLVMGRANRNPNMMFGEVNRNIFQKLEADIDTSSPQSGPLPGQIIVDPDNATYLVYNRDSNSDGKLDPFYMCGPGDPEDFLYRGTRQSNGTRNGGDQMTIINAVKNSGANSLYMQAVRSHGGDGDRTQNPFEGSNPSNPLDQDILNQWEDWFDQMDNNGIVIYFFFYDDDALVWNTGNTVGNMERAFIQGLVNKFEHHKNLIWCVAEEYNEDLSITRVLNIAYEIRAADDHDHVIAVHHAAGHSGGAVTWNFDFANKSNIDQWAYEAISGHNKPNNVDTPQELHNSIVAIFSDAKGRYNINMAEYYTKHVEQLKAGDRTGIRRNNWACGLAGAHAMVIGPWGSWYGGDTTPTSAMLADMGRQRTFFESTDFNTMSPRDDLKYGGTDWVLAKAGSSYIAYASSLSGNIGLKGLNAGTYSFKWFDCVDGDTVNQTKTLGPGDQSWSRPPEIGTELAVHIKRIGGAGCNP